MQKGKFTVRIIQEGTSAALPDGGPYTVKINDVEFRFYIKDKGATVGGGGDGTAGLAIGGGLFRGDCHSRSFGRVSSPLYRCFCI